jgi:hypothetical protein
MTTDDDEYDDDVDDEDYDEEKYDHLYECVEENRVEDALAILAGEPDDYVAGDMHRFHQQVLHAALANGSETLVKALLAHGADVFGATRRGTTCLEYAFCYCSPALFAPILQAPAVTVSELQCGNDYGQTLLGLMASRFMDGDYVPEDSLDAMGNFSDTCYDWRNDNLRLLFAAFPDICLDGVFSVPWWRNDENVYDYVGLAKLAAMELDAPRMLECAALIEEEQTRRSWETGLAVSSSILPCATMLPLPTPCLFPSDIGVIEPPSK